MHVAQAVAVPTKTKAILTAESAKLKAEQKLSVELVRAIFKDDADAVRAAVRAGADVNREICGKKPIVIAAIHNKEAVFGALLQLGANCNVVYDDAKLVHFLCSYNTKFATMLVSHGADFSGPHHKYFDPMIWAVGDLKLFAELVKRGYNVKEMSNDVFWTLVRYPDVLEFCLQHGFNPNRVKPNMTYQTKTPLTTAVNGNAPLRSIKLLLDAGADVNLCAPKSPLYYAIERGDTKIIDLLVEHGAQL